MEVAPGHQAGQPNEFARVVLLLAIDDGSYLTGQTRVMDGGQSVNWGGA